MNTRFTLMVTGCVCAAVLAFAQPAPAADGNIYDFDSLTAGSIHGQDNWVDLDVANDNLEVYPPHPSDGLTWYGDSAPPCQDLYLTMSGAKKRVFAATRNNDTNWTFDLSGATKFVLGAPWVTDNGPVIDGVSRYGGEFRIVNLTTEKGIGFGASGTTSPSYRWKAFVDTADGVSQSSTHDTGHTYQDGEPRTAYYPNSRIDFRMEVDVTANEGEGGATLYTVRRWAGETTWNAVPALTNVDLQLVTQGADITNADQIYVWIGTRSVAQDSLIVAIPTAGPLTAKVFLDKGLDGTYDGSDELLSGFDMTIAGPCGCGAYGESPWDGATDPSGELTVSQSRAGAPAGFDKLDDGTYKITDRELYYYQATDPCEVSLTAGGGAQTASYGVRPHLGDANIDGIVDGQDFTFLKANFGGSGKLWTHANFNEDDIVDGQDFTILKAYFGTSHPEYTGSGGAGVPEPATLLLLGWGAAAALLRRRRSNR